MIVSRALAGLAIMLCALMSSSARAGLGEPSLQEIDDAITELDVQRARELIDRVTTESPGLALLRARLANYLGDCDTVAAILSSPELAAADTTGLGDVGRRCAGVIAGATVIEDAGSGIRLVLQDDADRVLVPFVTDVVVRARAHVEHDLGVRFPRPLRIVMVRDLFSLSAVSGLPLAAAETTGTVAVARWGRVTIISPRATALGYPWEDTMAHELTHLALSRATRDFAPLWLQEGVAKREETRWRAPRPFDRTPDPTETARAAMLSGRSVGIDKLGPSIAMLPTPEAASIAFAEVASFVSYWIEQNGAPAFQLLLDDLKGLGSHDADGAMRSVTGFPLTYWVARWRAALMAVPPEARPGEPPTRARGSTPARAKPDELARQVRLGDLLQARGYSAAASLELAPALAQAGSEAAIRWRAAKAELGAGRIEEARRRLGTVADVDAVVGPWFALSGRLDRTAGAGEAAEQAFRLGISADPLSEEVACEGSWAPRSPGAIGAPPPTVPKDPARRALCEAVRASSRD
ncbi:MAG: hypothetical protein OZ921_01380 [Sorangiineae bacterium]|nr:hypothetical protein [Polyangiaceae bacterium]MEB2321136.1 hypothetical protein [Sorangiineae bacterium]